MVPRLPSLPLHRVGSSVRNDSTLAPLGRPDASLLTLAVASFAIPKDLCVRLWMASVTVLGMVGRHVMGGSWPGLSGLHPCISTRLALRGARSPRPIGRSLSTQPSFPQNDSRLLDWQAHLDGERVDAVNSARLPRRCTAEVIVKLRLRECKPSATPSSLDNSTHSTEDASDVPVIIQQFTAFLLVYAHPQHQSIFRAVSLVVIRTGQRSSCSSSRRY